MKRIRCLIVDDEKEAREGLQLMLKSREAFEVLALCKDGIEAISKINALRPDLIFLDIQMPEINGFEVLASIERPLPTVVFVTAYDQYALKAFEVHALDYLLKPFDDRRFESALDNIRKHLNAGRERLDRFISQHKIDQSESGIIGEVSDSRLVFKTDGKVIFRTFPEIIWIEAYDYYIKIYDTLRMYVIRDSLKNMSKRLNERFVRVHKSAIVNLDHIQQIETVKSESFVVLNGNYRVKVSRNSRSELLSRIK